MAVSLHENCSIGIQLNIECQKSASLAAEELVNIDDMSQEKKDLLRLCTELSWII
jgi:hypothetical protein